MAATPYGAYQRALRRMCVQLCMYFVVSTTIVSTYTFSASLKMFEQSCFVLIRLLRTHLPAESTPHKLAKYCGSNRGGCFPLVKAV